MQKIPQTQSHNLLNLNAKTILITGAAGFIGSNLAEYFAINHSNCRILALDYFRDSRNFANGNPTTLGHFKNLVLYPNIEILPLDIANPKDMKKLCKNYGKIDYIFHEAAVSDTTCMDMKHVLNVNLLAFKELIQIAIKHHAHIIYASSAATYGNSEAPNSVGQNEIPENIYGYSKLCMDKENIRLQEFLQQQGIGLIGLRYFNVYGKNEFYKHKTSSMILQLALQALTTKEVKLFEFGEQQRDFVHINDVVVANLKALELLVLTYGMQDAIKHTREWQKVHKAYSTTLQEPIKDSLADEEVLQKIFGNTFKDKSKQILNTWLENGAIYNVGFGISRSYNDIIEILKKELDINFEVKYIKNPYPFFQNHTLANPLHFVPNYVPQYTLEAGIKEYIPHILTIYEEIKEGKKSW